ncbi:unnamed protein product [Prunus brigantina]
MNSSSKLQRENKLKEKERNEAHRELQKKEEVAALRAKLELMEGTGSGKKEEEINLKVTDRELEKKLEECQHMANEFVELERRRMEERILQQQQQEAEMLRRRLEEIEPELCRSGDGNGGMVKSMDLDMGDQEPFAREVKYVGGIAYQSDSSIVNAVNIDSFEPKYADRVCLSTVFEEEEMEEEEGLKENVEAEEVEKEVTEEKRVCMVDGSSLQSTYNMGSLTSLPKDYQHTPTLSQHVTTPAPTVASVKSENEQKLTEEVNKMYVKWEASKENPGKFITTFKVVKDASLADLRKLIAIYLGADNQAFTFLMLGDPTGASDFIPQIQNGVVSFCYYQKENQGAVVIFFTRTASQAASVAATRDSPARGGAAAPPCALIGPLVTDLVCSNRNQGQLVFCKQHGAARKERSFKSLPGWLKRVVFLPLITMLSQKHSISRVPAHLTSQCLKNWPRRPPRGLYLEEGTPSSCSQNERQTKDPSSRMHGSWTFLFPFPFRKEHVRGKDSDISVTYRLVREYCGIEVDVDKLENAFTGTSPGSRLFGFIGAGATLGQRFGSLFAMYNLFLQGDPFLGIFRNLDLSFPLRVTMMIIPPVADMRYESFLDKSKQDIESSGLVLGRSLVTNLKVYDKGPAKSGQHVVNEVVNDCCIPGLVGSISSDQVLVLYYHDPTHNNELESEDEEQEQHSEDIWQ